MINPELLRKLSELRDIHIPEEPSVFPLAVGWWVLIFIFITFLSILSYFLFKKRLMKLKQKQLRKNIINGYKEVTINISNDNHLLVSESSEYLKRFVKFTLNESRNATLSGEKWIEYLQNKVGDRVIFENEVKDALNNGVYNPNIDFSSEKLINFVINWLEDVIESKKIHNIECVNV